MAPRTERSASRLCGSVRSATAVWAMSELGRWDSDASEVRTDGNVLEERRKNKARIPTEVEIRVLGIRPNRTLALLGGRCSWCSRGTFGNDLHLDGGGPGAVQLYRHVHLAELLDRIGKLQLAAIDVEAAGSQRLGDVRGRHRAVQGLGVADATRNDDLDVGQPIGLRLDDLALVGFLRLELRALPLDLLLVAFSGQ